MRSGKSSKKKYKKKSKKGSKKNTDFHDIKDEVEEYWGKNYISVDNDFDYFINT